LYDLGKPGSTGIGNLEEAGDKVAEKAAEVDATSPPQEAAVVGEGIEDHPAVHEIDVSSTPFSNGICYVYKASRLALRTDLISSTGLLSMISSRLEIKGVLKARIVKMRVFPKGSRLGSSKE
jgi:hypothetical protein